MTDVGTHIAPESTMFKFVPAEAHTQDGRAVAVMLIEDPLNYMRPATAVEQALNTENERLRRALERTYRYIEQGRWNAAREESSEALGV